MVMVPSSWRRASCWKALWVPCPISKSLFLPPSRHNDLPALALYLVDGPGIAGTEEQVAVGLHVYGVDVEVVVEIVGIFGQLDVGLLDADVIEAVPLEEDLPGLDVHLLGDPFPHHAVLRAADRGEVRSRLRRRPSRARCPQG